MKIIDFKKIPHRQRCEVCGTHLDLYYVDVENFLGKKTKMILCYKCLCDLRGLR